LYFALHAASAVLVDVAAEDDANDDDDDDDGVMHVPAMQWPSPLQGVPSGASSVFSISTLPTEHVMLQSVRVPTADVIPSSERQSAELSTGCWALETAPKRSNMRIGAYMTD